MTGTPIHLLRFAQCKFAVTPHEARSHLFCADPVEHVGSPYCAAHAAVCFDRRPAEMRRAQADHMRLMREMKPRQKSGGPIRRAALTDHTDGTAA